MKELLRMLAQIVYGTEGKREQGKGNDHQHYREKIVWYHSKWKTLKAPAGDSAIFTLGCWMAAA